MILRRTFNSLALFTLRHDSVSSVRFYSVFPPTYIKPIYKKDKQQMLDEEQKTKALAHIPIKPAFSSETCSEFHDELVSKFTNYVMRKGRKELARKLVDETFENIKIIQLKQYYDTPPEYREQIALDPKQIFYRAVENCTPVLELMKVVRGGITYQVPVPMNSNRAQFLAMNWLIQTAQEKNSTDKFSTVLAREILNASKNEGRVMQKKHELHKQCEANRAYAHYRWL
ncbi:mitochondrial ribosomal protein S7 [Xylocopa sonorina]|uniref:mitochondrial ribosomal protein S7 n=1 Tax=Xylocopa sonorina TaxID=1818115 RepID=UPI00403B11C5